MRIGIIGAGQLGQMLGFAAQALGQHCRFLDPSPEPPAAAAGPVMQAAFDDIEALTALAEACDVITYEFENVPVDALTRIARAVPVYPPPAALRQAQDRLLEKRLFDRLAIALPAYRAIDSPRDLQAAIDVIGLPLVVKTRRLGYDGKGQFVLRTAEHIDTAFELLGTSELIAEQWVDFDYEVSAIGARNAAGDIVTYPLTRNVHRDGILRESYAPADNGPLAERANSYLRRLLEHLDYVGVVAIEFFVVGDELLANEFAPRVHNSGHWTIEGAATSQFENHLLAISNRPLGPTDMRGYAGMLNLIGQIPDAARSLATGHLHDYGKTPRPGRKLGHITVVSDSAEQRDRMLDEIIRSVTHSLPGEGPVS
jgi:5-(carboxyamino)imidazole ribonucleotide synthase